MTLYLQVVEQSFKQTVKSFVCMILCEQPFTSHSVKLEIQGKQTLPTASTRAS